MAATVVTPVPTLPSPAAGGVDPVHQRRGESRQERKERRRPIAAAAPVPEDEPEPVALPAGRLDVIA